MRAAVVGVAFGSHMLFNRCDLVERVCPVHMDVVLFACTVYRPGPEGLEALMQRFFSLR